MSQAPFAVRDIRWGTKFGSNVAVHYDFFTTYVI